MGSDKGTGIVANYSRVQWYKRVRVRVRVRVRITVGYNGTSVYGYYDVHSMMS